MMPEPASSGRPPGALGDGEAVLVHVAGAGIGMGRLGYVAEVAARVPVAHLAHFAGGVVGGGLLV